MVAGWLVFFAVSVEAATHKIVECRYVTPSVSTCKPYTRKLLVSEEIRPVDRKPLIIQRVLPVPIKPAVSETTIGDRIASQPEADSPQRYAGSQSSRLAKRREIYQKLAEKLAKQKAELEAERAHLQAQLKAIEAQASKPSYASYSVRSGDTMGAIAKRFGMQTSELLRVNALDDHSLILIGQKLQIPGLSQAEVDRITAEAIQRQSELYPSVQFAMGKSRFKNSLRVQATAYTSHENQTDDTPLLAAWNNRIEPGMKIIAVSRDLIHQFGLGNGKQVKIEGLPGTYTVRDKMNKRLRRTIDIYMGTNLQKALEWGRKRVVIYW
jgi:LysM repeat protein